MIIISALCSVTRSSTLHTTPRVRYSNWFKGSPLSLTEGCAALQQCQLTANVEMPLRGEVSVGDQRVAGGTPQHPAQVVHAGGEVEDALRHVPVH